MPGVRERPPCRYTNGWNSAPGFAMPTTNPSHRADELARLGGEVFDRRVEPSLRPEDDGKFVAIDVRTGEYEIDPDDYTAVSRLGPDSRGPSVELARAGSPATCRIGRG